MKKINGFSLGMMIMLLLSLVLLMLPGKAQAETLKTDNNGIPIQLSRYFTTVSDSIPAQAAAVYDSIAVPANAAEVMIVGRHQGLLIKGRSTTTIAATEWIYVPKDIVYRIPVMDAEYICYRSTTGAAAIHITWLRM